MSRVENKVGAVNWSVGKLVNIILLVAVLVLVVYGATTKGFGPLMERVEGKYDDVLILLGISDEGLGECMSIKVSERNKGKELLEKLGSYGDDAILGVCRNGVCTISGDKIGTYRLIDGKIDLLNGESWKSYDDDFVSKAVLGKKDWERYSVAVEFLKSEGVRDIYDEAFSKRFVLYGDGFGLSEEAYAIWQNGEWVVQENKEDAVYFVDDEKAIDAFVDIVFERKDFRDGILWNDDNIIRMNEVAWPIRGEGLALGTVKDDVCKNFCDGEYGYRERGYDSSAECGGILRNDKICCCRGDDLGFDVVVGKMKGDSIESLIGGGNDEIDNDAEAEKLKIEFNKTKRELVIEASIFTDDVKMDKMRGLVGKRVNIGDKEFVVGLDEGLDFPIVTFVSGGEEFGLNFAAFGKVNSELLERVKLEYYPVYLVEKSGGEWKRIGDEEIYRLPEKNFKEAVFGGLIIEFLKEQCR